MTKLKIAMIACVSVLALATGAQDLRIGNGSTSVTINPSSDGNAATYRNQGSSPVGDHRFGAANGSR
jgi:hypothetical protein